MKLLNFKTGSKWFVTWLSVVTFVISPVAMGQEAQAVSTQQVKNALEQMGLNKKITVGEFYQNTKHLYPERIRSQIEPVMMNFKNTMMPEFTVNTAKGTDGSDVPNVSISYNGQLLNFQWFGEKDKFVKFQNTILSEIDIINFSDMFSRILASDENLRRQIDVKTIAKPTAKPTASNKSARFEYPTVTQESWKKMTPQDRANYMINLRQLWNDARTVLFEIEKNKSGRSKKNSSLDKLDLLWKTLIEQNADAAPITKKIKVIDRARNDIVEKPITTPGDSQSCLVAGYATSYNSQYCDHEKIDATYLKIPNVEKAMSFCVKPKIACNPIVFGTPNGVPICIDPQRSNKDFQIATHYEGPCERNNHLSSKIKFLADENKQKGRYENNTVITDIRAEVMKEQNGNYKATEDFLNGLLKFQGAGDNLFTSSKPIDQSTIDKIIEIKNQFEHDIGEAISSCKASSSEGSHKDKNFWQACDQLQRRFLFIGEYLQLKCPAGSNINDKYKCACGVDDKFTEVLPGADKCTPPVLTQPPVVPPVVVTPNPPPVKPTEPVKPSPEECPAGTIKKSSVGLPGSSVEGVESFKCVPDAKKKTEKVGNGVWDFLKGLAPFALGGIALFAMYKLFSPKKPALNPAGDFCQGGFKPPPCTPVCPLNQAPLPGGACGCAACAPGQINDPSTCLCSSTPVTPVNTLLTCPDGFTKVTNLASCPLPSYNCWDGAKVSNPLNCKEKPVIVVPRSSQ